jgi:D-alanyl-D-alanine carboxypeptidase
MHLQRPFLVALLAIVVATSAVVVVFRPAQTAKTTDRPELLRSLDRFVRDNVVAPGVTAYIDGPRGTWAGAAGFTNLKTETPMPADARMRLESVSKAWTATLILQLAGEGKLGLDDTVSKWLPRLLPYGNRITIRQLLSHTSGLIDNNDIGKRPSYYVSQVRDAKLHATLVATGNRLAKNQALEFSPRLWIAFAGALPLLSQPGTTYHYSNIGYEVAGLIAEKVSGKPLAQLNRDGIIDPLGLKSAAYDPQGPITGPHATLYYLLNGKHVDASAWHAGIGGEGGIVSDARDEARFAQALMGGKLLKPAELEQMQTPQPGAGDYTLGFVKVRPSCGGVAFEHGGAGAGDKTEVVVSPDGTRVAVVLANGGADNAAAYYAAVESLATRLYCAA